MQEKVTLMCASDLQHQVGLTMRHLRRPSLAPKPRRDVVDWETPICGLISGYRWCLQTAVASESDSDSLPRPPKSPGFLAQHHSPNWTEMTVVQVDEVCFP